MRRLIVGCGYLGVQVARLWREAGDEVYATTRGQRTDALYQMGLRPLPLDVTLARAVPTLPEVDTVVFAVGRDRYSDVRMADIHVRGLRTALDALSESTGRVIYVSSTGVYGQNDGEWVDETSLCEPTSEGGKACLSAEQLLFAHARGRDAVALRMAGLYGPGRVPRSADVAAGATIAGSPNAYLNLIHVEDAAGAVVEAADTLIAAGRTYIVSDGSPVTRGEYVARLATHHGVRTPHFLGGHRLGKRVLNARAIRELALTLTYPSYEYGLAGALMVHT